MFPLSQTVGSNLPRLLNRNPSQKLHKSLWEAWTWWAKHNSFLLLFKPQIYYLSFLFFTKQTHVVTLLVQLLLESKKRGFDSFLRSSPAFIVGENRIKTRVFKCPREGQNQRRSLTEPNRDKRVIRGDYKAWNSSITHIIQEIASLLQCRLHIKSDGNCLFLYSRP